MRENILVRVRDKDRPHGEGHTSSRAAATLGTIGHGDRRRSLATLISAKPTTAQGNVVGTCDSLVAPGHDFKIKGG